MNKLQPRPAKDRLEQIGSLIGSCFSRLFSETRVLARMKLAAFTSFLVLVGMGLVVRLRHHTYDSDATRFAEFVLSSPSFGQTTAALLALVFILLANLYSQIRRQEYQKELLKIAANPNTPEKVRQAILSKLGS